MSEGRAHRLTEYVNAAVAQPVVWGKSDCCSWPAAWAALEGGHPVDLPSYSSIEEAQALILKAGGLDKLAAQALSRFERTEFPQLGDVGVIRLSDRDVGVIFCTNGIAAWRTDHGSTHIHPKNVLAAWTV